MPISPNPTDPADAAASRKRKERKSLTLSETALEQAADIKRATNRSLSNLTEFLIAQEHARLKKA